jgi:hypothetical protein
MDTKQPAREPGGRWVQLSALVVTLLATFGAGYFLGNRDRRPEVPNVSPLPAPDPDLPIEPLHYQPIAERPIVPPEPAASAARARAIASSRDAIVAECQKAAGGDWQRWERDTEPYRAALRARFQEVKPFDPVREYWLEGKQQALAPRDHLPLFEVYPRESLRYLCDPSSLDRLRHDRVIAAARRWLAQRGIDLILVVVPTTTEVYIEHFIDPSPADGIVSPTARRMLLDLLRDDVEVVDGFPLFRGVRQPDPDYLFNTADTHWAPRGMDVMAKEVGERIGRYQFAARARLAPPIVITTPEPFDIQHTAITVHFGDLPNMDGWFTLTAKEQERARAAQTYMIARVTMPDGSDPPDNPKSPILLIGHSYLLNFREKLIKETNILPKTIMGGGFTTEAFAQMLRQPELLDNCRLVVWVTTGKALPNFAQMPSPILRTLETK